MIVDDDDANILAAIKRTLKKEQWSIDTFSLATEALDQLSVHRYEVILSDYRMPIMDGISFLA